MKGEPLTVYLVYRETLNNVTDPDTGYTDVDQELIAICSTLEKAKLYVDAPNFDIVVTSWEVDNDESEKVLIGDLDSTH